MSQAAQIILLYYVVPCAHQHAKSSRCTIPYGNTILLYHTIPIIRTKSSTSYNIGRTVEPWSEDAICGSSYPPRICRTPKYVILLQIQYDLSGIQLLHHDIVYVVNAFRLTCRTRCIMEDKAILTIYPLDCSLITMLLHQLAIADHTFLFYYIIAINDNMLKLRQLITLNT